MKLEFALIRHGYDSGGRLTGITDKPMSDEGRRIVEERAGRGDYPR